MLPVSFLCSVLYYLLQSCPPSLSPLPFTFPPLFCWLFRSTDLVEDTKTADDDDADEYAGLTKTEIRFLKRQKEREKEDVKKMATKSHRERVEDLNQYLAALPVHNDVPKVAAAGLG